MKTSTMGCPSMWNTAPQRIERTTINCLWKFLQRACPFGPWGIVPTAAACVWLVFVSNKRLIGWLSWHGKGSKTLLRQDEKEEEEAQQPSPMSPEVIIMSIKCVMKTKQGQVLNNLTSAPLQTLINSGKQLREIIQREPERLGAVVFLNSIEPRPPLHN